MIAKLLISPRQAAVRGNPRVMNIVEKATKMLIDVCTDIQNDQSSLINLDDAIIATNTKPKHPLTFFREQLAKNEAATAYCERRGLGEDVLKEWEMGYAPDAGEALAVHLKKKGHSLAECAQALGRRMFLMKPQDTEKSREGISCQKIQWAFELCLARKPAKNELARLVKLYEDERQLVSKNPGATAQLVGDVRKPNEAVEAASMVAVAQVLMNLDEFVTRE